MGKEKCGGCFGLKITECLLLAVPGSSGFQRARSPAKARKRMKFFKKKAKENFHFQAKTVDVSWIGITLFLGAKTPGQIVCVCHECSQGRSEASHSPFIVILKSSLVAGNRDTRLLCGTSKHFPRYTWKHRMQPPGQSLASLALLITWMEDQTEHRAQIRTLD